MFRQHCLKIASSEACEISPVAAAMIFVFSQTLLRSTPYEAVLPSMAGGFVAAIRNRRLRF
jgi:hypothetical protein